MKAQLKELASNDTFKALFSNLNKIGAICLSIPVTTASIERTFSQMKFIKTHLSYKFFEDTLNFAVFVDFTATSKINPRKSYYSIHKCNDSLVDPRNLIHDMYH